MNSCIYCVVCVSISLSLLIVEVEEYRVELEGIKVRGKGCPKPIKTWAHCGCSKKVMDSLKK